MLLQNVRVSSILLLCSIPSCKCTTALFLSHSFFHPTHGHLDCFQFLAIVNSAVINIGVHIFFVLVFNLQNIQKPNIAQCQENKQSNEEMGKRPE